MTATEGIVKVHRQEHTLLIQVVGWGRMNQSLPLRHFVENCLQEGANRLYVDLRHCTYLDSTFLGTLLYMRRQLQIRGLGQLVLVSPSPECCELLHQIGVNDLFPRELQEEMTCAWLDLCGSRNDVYAFNRTVVEAHQELANLDGAAGKAFKAVAKGLTDEWEKLQKNKGEDCGTEKIPPQRHTER